MPRDAGGSMAAEAVSSWRKAALIEAGRRFVW